ncbi:unnamed protein product [Calicophoron daubneyi]|uniref:Acyltransferase n=1 Tax=Calicophoron daubneyi TaxID=300641 RepID=A0AAV2T400_CALDB
MIIESLPNAPPQTIIVKPRVLLPGSKKSRFKQCIEICATALIWIPLICYFMVLYSLATYFVYKILRCVSASALSSGANPNSQAEAASSTNITIWSYQTVLWGLIMLYAVYYYFDRGVEDRDGHETRFVRNWRLWDQYADFFPVQMILSDELVKYSREQAGLSHEGNTNSFPGLPADRNYLVGYHPHGMFVVGVLVNFLTEANCFSKTFPNLKPWVAGHHVQFFYPLYRDWLLYSGCTSVSREALLYHIDPDMNKNKGNFVVVVVGGAPEMLEAHPGRYVMYLKKRFGFFKLALETGSSLIPCISFGEPGIVGQVWNPPGSKLRRLQEFGMNFTRIPFPYPVFRYFFPVPRRKPINTVIGAPIPCERILNPTNEQVEEIKQLYLERLEGLFKRYKDVYDPGASEIVFI